MVQIHKETAPVIHMSLCDKRLVLIQFWNGIRYIYTYILNVGLLSKCQVIVNSTNGQLYPPDIQLCFFVKWAFFWHSDNEVETVCKTGSRSFRLLCADDNVRVVIMCIICFNVLSLTKIYSNLITQFYINIRTRSSTIDKEYRKINIIASSGCPLWPHVCGHFIFPIYF